LFWIYIYLIVSDLSSLPNFTLVETPLVETHLASTKTNLLYIAVLSNFAA